jgi:hypothetical protein
MAILFVLGCFLLLLSAYGVYRKLCGQGRVAKPHIAKPSVPKPPRVAKPPRAPIPASRAPIPASSAPTPPVTKPAVAIKVLADYQIVLDKPFLDPFTGIRMVDPVLAMDGITYERNSIEKWFTTNNNSPIVGYSAIDKTLIPNMTLFAIMRRFPDFKEVHQDCFYHTISPWGLLNRPVVRCYDGETYEQQMLDDMYKYNGYYDLPSIIDVELEGRQYVGNFGLFLQISNWMEKENPNGIRRIS